MVTIFFPSCLLGAVCNYTELCVSLWRGVLYLEVTSYRAVQASTETKLGGGNVGHQLLKKMGETVFHTHLSMGQKTCIDPPHIM